MNVKSILYGLVAIASMTLSAEDKDIPQHLQDISVTIVSEGEWSKGEGSGVVFTRKDKDGNVVNFVWTAAHVIDNLRSTREVIVNGGKKTIVEFKDPKVVKEIKQDGRTVGRIEMDAEVLKYSDADTGHDLAILKLRKRGFVKDTTVFYLDDKIPSLGTDLLHVGSLLGQMGANSMTAGIYSQHGRLIGINKFVFDQTTVNAFPGSSGGGVYNKSDAKYIGMLVRGAGETFNLIVPVRRMIDWAEKNDVEWALDPSKPMPSADELAKLPIEDTGGKDDKGDAGKKVHSHVETNKMFPFMLRVTPKTKQLPLIIGPSIINAEPLNPTNFRLKTNK